MNLRELLVLCLIAGLLWSTNLVAAEHSLVKSARVWHEPDGVRLVFDVNGRVKHKVFTLRKPERVVIDLFDSRLVASLSSLKFKNTPVKKLRSSIRRSDDLRVVLDMREKVTVSSFLLKPNKVYGHRLVVDLRFKSQTKKKKAAKSTVVRQPRGTRDIVIAIDAGHGGEDPGARGARNTKEKDVVLSIARRLSKLINAARGMRAVLVRDGDYYIGLRKRMLIARKKQADLFVSIHADAFRNRRAGGSSVYTLSQNGASSEAAHWLADKENAADFVGGVSLEDKDDMLASVLLDLAQTATSEASRSVASRVLTKLETVGRVHNPTVQHASFVVLKSPDIPSILVETAFISNPREEKKLRSSRYQHSVAKAMLKGIKSYFIQYPPAGTLLAARRRHTIERGDTLAKIAKLYQVSIKQLRRENKLTGDRIMPGQVLRIPSARES